MRKFIKWLYRRFKMVDWSSWGILAGIFSPLWNILLTFMLTFRITHNAVLATLLYVISTILIFLYSLYRADEG